MVMGSRDADFADPGTEAAWLGGQLCSGSLVAEGAGHYPQVEMPERLLPALLQFVTRVHCSQTCAH